MRRPLRGSVSGADRSAPSMYRPNHAQANIGTIVHKAHIPGKPNQLGPPVYRPNPTKQGNSDLMPKSVAAGPPQSAVPVFRPPKARLAIQFQSLHNSQLESQPASPVPPPARLPTFHALPPMAQMKPLPSTGPHPWVVQRMEMEESSVEERRVSFGQAANLSGIGKATESQFMGPKFYQKHNPYTGEIKSVPVSNLNISKNTHGYVFYHTAKQPHPKVALISQTPIPGYTSGGKFAEIVAAANQQRSEEYKAKTKLMPLAYDAHVHAEMNYMAAKIIEKDFDWAKIVAFFREKQPSLVTFNADGKTKGTCSNCTAAFQLFGGGFQPFYVKKSKVTYKDWVFPADTIAQAFAKRYREIQEQQLQAKTLLAESVKKAKVLLAEILEVQQYNPRWFDTDEGNNWLHIQMAIVINPVLKIIPRPGVPMVNEVLAGCRTMLFTNNSRQELDLDGRLKKLENFRVQFNQYVHLLSSEVKKLSSEVKKPIAGIP